MDLSKYIPSEQDIQEEAPRLSKEEYAAMKKQEREEVWAEIDTKTHDVFKDGNSMKGFLDFMAQCKPQKTPNLLLLYSQNPEIRQVKTFEKWKEEKRTLKTGVHGYRFIAGQSYEKDGVTMQGSTICKVYDISQIQMRIPEATEKRPVEELMTALLKETPVPVRVSDNLPEKVQAQYSPQQKAVYVKNGMGEVPTFHAIIRELACAVLDRRDGSYSRGEVIAQAFCAAYVVAEKNGVDTSGFQFDQVCRRQEYGNKDPKELRGFVGDVRNAAYALHTCIERNLKEQVPELSGEEFNVGESGKQESPKKEVKSER